jgi:hypothetical protein
VRTLLCIVCFGLLISAVPAMAQESLLVGGEFFTLGMTKKDVMGKLAPKHRVLRISSGQPGKLTDPAGEANEAYPDSAWLIESNDDRRSTIGQVTFRNGKLATISRMHEGTRTESALELFKSLFSVTQSAIPLSTSTAPAALRRTSSATVEVTSVDSGTSLIRTITITLGSHQVQLFQGEGRFPDPLGAQVNNFSEGVTLADTISNWFLSQKCN